MPKRFHKEFRDDVVRVSHSGKLSFDEIAHDFQISVSTIKRWLAGANIDDCLREGVTSTEHDELLRLRHENRRLLMENEILRRAAACFA